MIDADNETNREELVIFFFECGIRWEFRRIELCIYSCIELLSFRHVAIN